MARLAQRDSLWTTWSVVQQTFIHQQCFDLFGLRRLVLWSRHFAVMAPSLVVNCAEHHEPASFPLSDNIKKIRVCLFCFDFKFRYFWLIVLKCVDFSILLMMTSSTYQHKQWNTYYNQSSWNNLGINRGRVVWMLDGKLQLSIFIIQSSINRD